MRIGLFCASAALLLAAGCSTPIDGQAEPGPVPQPNTASATLQSPTNPQSTASTQPAASPLQTTDIPLPPQFIARAGEPCPEISDLTTDSDTGEWIVCISGGRTIPAWMAVGQVPAGVFNVGDPCTTDGRLGQTPDSKALMCNQGAWGYGP